jgi:shikimate kinase
MESIVLIGAPGSGKSTVGKLLAEHLNADFFDTDQLIETEANMSISDIFLNNDEKYFRKLERACVNSVLERAKTSHSVISLGGGSILDPETQKDLEPHVVVWLRVLIGEAMKRVGMNQARPLLLGNVRANMIKLLEQRTPIYESLADITVDSSQMSPEQCVVQILDVISHERNNRDPAN